MASQQPLQPPSSRQENKTNYSSKASKGRNPPSSAAQDEDSGYLLVPEWYSEYEIFVNSYGLRMWDGEYPSFGERIQEGSCEADRRQERLREEGGETGGGRAGDERSEDAARGGGCEAKGDSSYCGCDDCESDAAAAPGECRAVKKEEEEEEDEKQGCDDDARQPAGVRPARRCPTGRPGERVDFWTRRKRSAGSRPRYTRRAKR
ncbi:hypothetical protein MBM_05702 [Drepanopeziza brunnea f. sp. 'multigermtubi' MB_m1]|uniref:Uncharacterized protein n=1 Tax=Marssonina brunnea f. sp. multigermtubi (strain MB_m1) TaxID=1072389 RepID=K1X6X4_MARBU|nr:uncharacterized protein MBM_05702 [Drepanopeziza brunnea f. sp. 'multigermtubi' MB_m1]EKD16408.1 hypothetical protein MBM_05702 [Drepanopeziza brunnea f. sp. 'multigermtubi' MB_m1]